MLFRSLTCNFVVLDKEYDYDDPAYLPPSPYIPSIPEGDGENGSGDGSVPFVVILEKTVNEGEECQFDFEAYQQFPYYGIGVTACYTNEEGLYYCIKSDFTIHSFNSWG